jgi:Na+/melibiose symporter-like transporter
VIRFLSGPLPALLFAGGIVLCAFYPLTRERHARILHALKKKRALHMQFSEETPAE